MRCRALVLVSLMACTNWSEPEHEDTSPPNLPLGSIYFDCDTPTGNFSSWSQALDGGNGSASGAIYFHEKRGDSRWGSFVRVALGDESRQTRTGFDLVGARSDPGLAAFATYVDASGLRNEGLDVPDLQIRDDIQFEVQWESDGQIQVRIDRDGHWTSLTAPFEPERIWLECGSAWATFYSVTLAQQADGGLPN